MEYLRIKINSWTASFRYPIFIAGFQPSLKIPPLSTVYGLLSAVKGEYVTEKDTKVGYLFFSQGNTVDLESVYELQQSNLKYKKNVCKREILFDNELYLYVDALDFEPYLKSPEYPVVLGRSQDVAMISEIQVVELQHCSHEIKVGKTIIPFPTKGFHGTLQALPKYFTDTIPREAVGTRPYYLVEDFIPYQGEQVWYDAEKEWGVWMHGHS